jgi:hypothetical protein
MIDLFMDSPLPSKTLRECGHFGTAVQWPEAAISNMQYLRCGSVLARKAERE